MSYATTKTVMKGNHSDEVAFTVIELLVVIAVIAILAALLFPSLNRAKDRAKRTTCMNNLKQINLGLRMYTDDFSDLAPNTPAANTNVSMNNLVAVIGYKKLMKHNVGLKGESSPQDKVFACPADTFYFDAPPVGLVQRGFHDQAFTDYSSYAFNAGGTNRLLGLTTAGLAGRKITSIKDPSRTLLLTEDSALFPFSWHEPRRPISLENAIFKDAKNIVSFVDGHVDYLKIYWNTNRALSGGKSYGLMAPDFDPPSDYGYKWKAD